jgi:hypothetical protein
MKNRVSRKRGREWKPERGLPGVCEGEYKEYLDIQDQTF